MAGPSSRRRRGGRASSRVRLHARRLLRRVRRQAAWHLGRLGRTPEEVGIDEPRRWRRRAWSKARLGLAYVGALLLLAWVGRAAWVVFLGGGGLGWDERCSRSGLSCGALTGFVLPPLSLALATALFLSIRMWLVPRERRKLSRTAPQALVPTAGAVAGRVVGRDELCKVLVDNLRVADGRRPQLIVGGVGTGKTAVIVQLTRLLAQYRATPVAIRLRDVQASFRFSTEAREQFQRQVHRRALSAAEEDRIWRQLRHEGRIVVLADGLEEALHQEGDRDDLIRLAIAQARADDLPLVIASRPHDSLRGMDASILELEPMSEEAALEYLADGDVQGDARRLDWIVETAGVAEAPLYLRIAHELSREGLLDHLVTEDDEPGTVDTRDLDRSALRRNLLDTWASALARGQLRGHVPLSPEQRRATLVFIAALACVGLQQDRLEVKYPQALEKVEVDSSADPSPTRGGGPAGPAVQTCAHDEGEDDDLRRWVEKELERLPHLAGLVDARLAANWGAQLGLVEIRGRAVRFQHSVLQAYLGSLAVKGIMAEARASERFFSRAFSAPQRPGREVLIALVLLSRHLAAHRIGGRVTGAAAEQGETARSTEIVQRLSDEVDKHRDSKGLDILAAALEIDAVVEPDQRRQPELVEDAAARWTSFHAVDLRTLEEAKLEFISRCGEALREVGRRDKALRPAEHDGSGRRAQEARAEGLARAYRALFDIGCKEPLSYPVRHAVTQQVGAGGATAFRALEGRFQAAMVALDDQDGQDEEAWRQLVGCAWLAALLLGGAPRESPAEQSETGRAAAWGKPPERDLARENLDAWLRRVGKPELRGRRSEADGGRRPARAGRTTEHGPAGADPAVPADAAQRPARRPAPRRAVRPQASVPPPLPISVEVALAQGFKYAANRRERHPRAQVDGRTHLAEQALELLKRSGFWFSQLTLLHALGLWALPDVNTGGGPRIPGPSTAGAYGPDITLRVHHWVDLAGSLRDEGREPRRREPTGEVHPFVREAGELVIKALVTGRPERFMWIDEHGVTSKIGASATSRAELRKHHLWIPPSIGWSALDPRAQVLVGEVLLLMNLADRGAVAGAREERLGRANRPDLPPCLTRDRHLLDPNREVGVLEDSEPGKTCPGECQFRLCPYPPKGRVTYHAELSEAFCRRQQTQRGLARRRAPWQEMLPRELRMFWGEMATRARR